MPLLNVRHVWVIQMRSTGLYLTEELGYSRLLRDAGRCDSREAALDTGRMNLDDDFAVSDFYVREAANE